MWTRREFGKLALAGAAGSVCGTSLLNSIVSAAERPNSLINGVQIGTITYSYRSMPDQSAQATLRYIVDSGINAIELMNGPAESYAGAPPARADANQLKQWRLSVSMYKYKALRKMYNDAGVKIYAWKCLNSNMSDEEFEYVFNVAEALGCTHTTLELTDDMAQLKRIGEFAEKHKIYAAYHTHIQGSMTV